MNYTIAIYHPFSELSSRSFEMPQTLGFSLMQRTVFATWSLTQGLGLQCSSQCASQCCSLPSGLPVAPETHGDLGSCEKPLDDLLFLNLFSQYRGYAV